LTQWVIVVPCNAQVRESADGSSDLTGGRHHAERDAIIGA
jgi:hypothetical protein